MSNVVDQRGLIYNVAKVNADEVNASVALGIPTFTVATVPSAADNSGKFIFVTDGDAGAATFALSDGANWDVAIGANAGTPIADS